MTASTPEKSIENAIRSVVETGQLAGAAALVWRNGAVRHLAVAGVRDLRSGLPIERETIFRIASLTKPVTTVAGLSMLDAGHFTLDEPIARCAPEFARVRVLRDPPTTGTNKIVKRTLVHQKWRADRVGGDGVYVRLRDEPAYRELGAEEEAALRASFVHHQRERFWDL